MPAKILPDSEHFSLCPLAEGVYACIHKPGGAGFSNAGIIDLGSVTLAVDAFNSVAAGADLRRAAQTLFDCPVETLILTHAHNDHWIGTTAFDEDTTLLATETTAKFFRQLGEELVKDFNPDQMQKTLESLEQRALAEKDERVLAGLKNMIIRTRTALLEMPTYQPRYPDHTFEGRVDFYGQLRRVELRSMGRGHSADDAVVFLPEDGIAFIGDIGFFNSQPFLGYCDIDLYRKQLHSFLEDDYPILVPGHGPVGGKEDIRLQLEYMDVLEELVGKAVHHGASYEQALDISLPEPFSKWLMGGMERFKVNIQFMFKHCGGVLK